MVMGWRRAVTGLLIVSGLLSLGYVAISSYIAEQLVYEAPKAIVKTPASQALRFANVTFPSRDDHINLKGWLIPGVLPDGRLTVDRVIVAVHGTRTNRESPSDHLLELTAALPRLGFGLLSFDKPRRGQSPPAPLSMARVLYGVDFCAARRVATVAGIAPRPLFLIHGTADDYVPIVNFRQLQAAASSAAGSRVTTWVVPNARHAQAFKKTGTEYVTRVVAFFDTALGAAA